MFLKNKTKELKWIVKDSFMSMKNIQIYPLSEKQILRNIAFNCLSQYQLLQSFRSILLVVRAFQVSFLVNKRKMNNINFWLTINLKLHFNKEQLSNEWMNAALIGKFATRNNFFHFLFSFFLSFFFFFTSSASGNLVIASNVIQFRISGAFFPKNLPLR